jgi:hypothetical protein
MPLLCLRPDCAVWLQEGNSDHDKGHESDSDGQEEDGGATDARAPGTSDVTSPPANHDYENGHGSHPDGQEEYGGATDARAPRAPATSLRCRSTPAPLPAPPASLSCPP